MVSSWAPLLWEIGIFVAPSGNLLEALLIIAVNPITRKVGNLKLTKQIKTTTHDPSSSHLGRFHGTSLTRPLNPPSLPLLLLTTSNFRQFLSSISTSFPSSSSASSSSASHGHIWWSLCSRSIQSSRLLWPWVVVGVWWDVTCADVVYKRI